MSGFQSAPAIRALAPDASCPYDRLSSNQTGHSPRMTDDPDRYNAIPSLVPVREEVVKLLRDAVSKDGNAFRAAAVATTDPDGLPQVRIMILRSFDPARMHLTVFTDGRSPKIRELTASPNIQLLCYDPGQRIQLRISGKVEIHQEDDLCDSLWAALPEYGRGDYLSRQPPGEQIAHPGDSWADKTLGGQNFTVLRVVIQSIDWLRLSGQGHRRALLTWDNGKHSARWLAP